MMAAGPAPHVAAGSGGDAAIRPRLLSSLINAAARDHAGKTAIDFMGRTWTYREIAAQVERAARGLQDRGIAKGMAMGLCLPNMPHYVVLYFALHRIGAIVVNINPLYTAREIGHLLEDSGAVAVATCDVADYHAKVVAVAGEIGLRTVIVCRMTEALPPAKRLLYRLFKRRDIARIAADGRQHPYARLLAARGAPDPVDRDPGDVAVFQYTGGTTGVPKAAMLTHANLTANCAQIAIHVSSVGLADERVMGVLPLFHVFALTAVLNQTVDAGGTMVLLPRFDMKQFLAAMKRTRCTQLYAVPTIYAAINKLPAATIAPLKALKFSISGGAPLPNDVRVAFEARVGCPVIEGYGLSETSPVIACNPIRAAKDGSCGTAFPATVLEIRDVDDPGRLLPQGERGEVCARGPQVMKGYWNRPDETAAVFVDGSLRTGDVGYLDEDGYLFLVDRIKDVILAGGYNIYPRTIEEALYQHPAVVEAVVIGVDDAYRGQAPKAFVTLRDGSDATPDALRAFLKDHLNKLEMPREIEVRDELPKTLIGKLSKKELVEEERAKVAGGGG